MFMKKTVISILLALVMVFTVAITAFAAIADNNVAVPYYTYIGTTATSFTVNTFSCDATGSMCGMAGVTKVNIKLQLQKEKDGVWSTVETWEKTVNGVSAALAGSANISPFSNYRLKATYTAYTASDSEFLVAYRYE